MRKHTPKAPHSKSSKPHKAPASEARGGKARSPKKPKPKY